MVYYNLEVGGIVTESKIPYLDVLARTGLKDQVGLAELGYVEYFEAETIVPPTNEQFFNYIRTVRTDLLKMSDWTQLPDAALSDAKKAEWAAYRNALRNFPSVQPYVTTPEQIAWPVEPSK
jgi:hypothetical protein